MAIKLDLNLINALIPEDVVGYVPRISGLGGGDYIRLSIENETGKIIGWKPITEEDLDN